MLELLLPLVLELQLRLRFHNPGIREEV